MKRLLIVLVAVTAFRARADDGATILRRVDQVRNPMESFAMDVELTSYTNGSKAETSKFRVYGKGSDKSVVEFVAPATEKGKFLLMLRDAMWIYMPSASKPIRISPLQRLMGQASNGDVARTNFTVDYNAVAVGEEELEGKKTWVLDLVAKDPSIAYNKVRLWVDRTSNEPMRADFYVVSGKLIKRASYRGRGVDIEDLLRAGNHTIMQYGNLTARANPDKMFTKDSLGKW